MSALLSLTTITKKISTLGEILPVPRFFLPPSAGVDISDSSIKWLTLVPAEKGFRLGQYGSRSIAPGIVVEGDVKDVPTLAAQLTVVARELRDVTHVHVALPEELGYVFNMMVPTRIPHQEVLRLVEFEFEGRVPIPPEQAVYDFDPIKIHEGTGMCEIGVTVFPKDVAQNYVQVFAAAGLIVSSLEIEARSIARAVTPRIGADEIELLADFGRARTGFALIKRGVPIFTTTVQIGGDVMTHVLMKELGLDEAQAEQYKNEEGILLRSGQKQQTAATIQSTLTSLADEIARHFHYWDTRRNDQGEKLSPVDKVTLVGGNANVKGLTDFIAATVHAEVHRGNVWRNVCSFDEYIPPIGTHQSLEYATAIGLALRGHSA